MPRLRPTNWCRVRRSVSRSAADNPCSLIVGTKLKNGSTAANCILGKVTTSCDPTFPIRGSAWRTIQYIAEACPSVSRATRVRRSIVSRDDIGGYREARRIRCRERNARTVLVASGQSLSSSQAAVPLKRNRWLSLSRAPGLGRIFSQGRFIPSFPFDSLHDADSWAAE